MVKNEIILQLFFVILVALIIALPVGRALHPLVVAYFHQELSVVPIAPVVGHTMAASESPMTIKSSKIAPHLISFPTLDLLLPVAAGNITNNQWQLYTDKVAWLVTSDEPGKGNTIIYGHNWKSLFGNLTKLAIGDSIMVQQNNQTYAYRVAEKRKILPTDVEAILSDQNQLTLYTCDGAFDQKRLVIIAKPV